MNSLVHSRPTVHTLAPIPRPRPPLRPPARIACGAAILLILAGSAAPGVLWGQGRQRELAEELEQIITSRLGKKNVTLDDGAKAELQAVVQKAAGRLAADGPSKAQMEEARANSQRLADAIAEGARPGASVTRERIQAVLGKICPPPFYPFC
jgi:hypothetical protein